VVQAEYILGPGDNGNTRVGALKLKKETLFEMLDLLIKAGYLKKGSAL
jgi:hypothetical protein